MKDALRVCLAAIISFARQRTELTDDIGPGDNRRRELLCSVMYDRFLNDRQNEFPSRLEIPQEIIIYFV